MLKHLSHQFIIGVMGNWNFEELENSLVSDAEKRITRGYQKKAEPAEHAYTVQPQSPPPPAPVKPEPAADAAQSIIGLKGPDTKGVQTYLPLKDYMRLMQQKTLRKQNIAQIAGEAIIDWLDRQEQKNA